MYLPFLMERNEVRKMYYLRIYNSERVGSVVLPFEDIDSVIDYVLNQHKRMMEYLKSDNQKYQNVVSFWDKDKHDMTLKESMENFDFGIFTPMYISITYELTPEYNEERYSEKIVGEEVISWEIIKNYPLKQQEIIDLMIDPGRECD